MHSLLKCKLQNCIDQIAAMSIFGHQNVLQFTSIMPSYAV
jgi:hypothetical protein